MEEKLIIPMLFFFIAALGGICLLIFCFRKNDDGYDYDKIMRMMHEQTDGNLDALSRMNKEKDKLEEKIRDKKKKLGMKLVNKWFKVFNYEYDKCEWEIQNYIFYSNGSTCNYLCYICNN